MLECTFQLHCRYIANIMFFYLTVILRYIEPVETESHSITNIYMSLTAKYSGLMTCSQLRTRRIIWIALLHANIKMCIAFKTRQMLLFKHMNIYEINIILCACVNSKLVLFWLLHRYHTLRILNEILVDDKNVVDLQQILMKKIRVFQNVTAYTYHSQHIWSHVASNKGSSGRFGIEIT